MDRIPKMDEEGEYTTEFKASLLRSLVDIKHRRVYSLGEVKNKLKIK